MPTFASCFTICSIVGGAIFFREFEGFCAARVALFALSALLTLLGVYLLYQRMPSEAAAAAAAVTERERSGSSDALGGSLGGGGSSRGGSGGGGGGAKGGVDEPIGAAVQQGRLPAERLSHLPGTDLLNMAWLRAEVGVGANAHHAAGGDHGHRRRSNGRAGGGGSGGGGGGCGCAYARSPERAERGRRSSARSGAGSAGPVVDLWRDDRQSRAQLSAAVHPHHGADAAAVPPARRTLSFPRQRSRRASRGSSAGSGGGSAGSGGGSAGSGGGSAGSGGGEPDDDPPQASPNPRVPSTPQPRPKPMVWPGGTAAPAPASARVAPAPPLPPLAPLPRAAQLPPAAAVAPAASSDSSRLLPFVPPPMPPMLSVRKLPPMREWRAAPGRRAST